MKLLIKIVLSLAVAFGTLMLLEVPVKFGLQHNRNFKISNIKYRAIDADLIVHGPCESEWMVDPNVLEQYVPYKAYNLAINHSDFADNYLLLDEYLRNQKKPKVVLLYVTPESFDSVVANVFNSYRFAYLLEDNRSKAASIIKEMDPKYWRASCLPFLRYSFYGNFIFYKSISGWLDFVQGRTTSRWPNGYVAPVHSYNAAFKSFRDLNPKEGVFLWSKRREKYFVELIKFIQKNQIALVLFESPVYFEALTYQKNREDHLRRIDSICQVYNVPYYRFDTLSMRMDKANYFSTYNTTVAGNNIFNSFLGKFLKDSLAGILRKQVED